MVRSTEREMEILQSIADTIDTEKYYCYQVEKRKDGFYLMPDEHRWFGDKGEFMGETFEQATVNICVFVFNLI